MARRATPVTKGRATPNKAATAAPENAKPTRRGRAKPQDDSPALDAAPEVTPDAAPAAETETMAPKPRRGRKSKAEMMSNDDGIAAAAASESVPEAAPESEPPAEPELPAMETAESGRPAPKAKPPKLAGSPRTTRRNREPEASAPPPLDLPDEPAADSPIASAVHWHAETGTVTFDWSTIEEVAAAEGVNQPMAKVLLAARAEGARSRWPF